MKRKSLKCLSETDLRKGANLTKTLTGNHFFPLSLSSKDFLLLKDLKNGLFLLMKFKMLLGKYLEIEH